MSHPAATTSPTTTSRGKTSRAWIRRWTGAGGGLVSTSADLASFLRALTRGQLLSTRAWIEMTRWQPGPEGFYDDYGLGLGRYRFPVGQVVGHHGVWGAFAFWSPELDAIITGTVNTGRVDRRPLLGAVMRALTD